MFPFHWSSDDPQISSTANHQIEIPQDLMEIMNNNYASAADDDNPLRIMVPVQASVSDKTDADMNPLPPLYKTTASVNDENHCDDICRKKKRGEVEKQRRQGMASLAGALRSLLPQEFMMAGKISMTDQMNETVDYIRHLQAEIKDLQLKLDKMKLIISTYGSRCSSSSCVVIIPCCDGVLQLLISQCLSRTEAVCPISVVMKLLSREGVNIFNYYTCHVGDRTVYKIQCETNVDAASMDLTKLQQELEALLD